MTDQQLVIDASVLVQLYVKDAAEKFTDVADDIVRRHVGGTLELVAPQFILYEIPSAIRRAVRRGRLEPSDAHLSIRHFFNLGLRTLGSDATLRPMIESAYVRGTALGCHLYDALYLVVAEVLGYRFITADQKLYDRIRDEVDYAIWVEDYELSP
ncbi:MAG: type II toxin-antitoxin system VapC family toxin [Dehalococcoidia bacterium]